MNKTAKLTLGAGALVLLAGVGLILLQGQHKPEPKFHGRVEDILPKPGELSGWQVTYAPIADTPEMKAKVNELLNYDQGIFAIYTRGASHVSVYLAYWQPGKMPVRAIAGHTPDVCWIHSGWTCTQRDELESLTMAGRPVAHTEHGVYTINGQTEHVVFWHIADGKIISYHTEGKPPWYAAITEFLRWGNAIKQEQFFLRISSDQPLADFWQTAVVQSVVEKVPGVLQVSPRT